MALVRSTSVLIILIHSKFIVAAVATSRRADVDDKIVAEQTGGKFKSCAQVRDAGACGHEKAKLGCPATCRAAQKANGQHVLAAANTVSALKGAAFDMTNTYLSISNVKYYRKEATSNGLGRWGSRSNNWDSVNTVSGGPPPLAWMQANQNAAPALFQSAVATQDDTEEPDIAGTFSNVQVGPVLNLDQDQTSHFDADLSFAGALGEVSAGANDTSNNSKGYALQWLQMRDTTVAMQWYNKYYANYSAGWDNTVTTRLYNYKLSNGKTPTNAFITGIWILVECLGGVCEDSDNCGGASVSGSTTKDGSSFNIGGGGCSSKTLTFSKNAIIAYSAAAFCFNQNDKAAAYMPGVPANQCTGIYKSTYGKAPNTCGCHTY